MNCTLGIVQYFMNMYMYIVLTSNKNRGPSWTWSYHIRIYSYLCNQCLSPIMIWVRTRS